MRVCFFAALPACLAALVASGYAQIASRGEADFSAVRLTAPPTASWPTNGGNLYNQRYSPLAAINRDNVAQLKGVWRARLRGSGSAPQYSGGAQPIVHDGVAYVSTGANDVFALSIDTGEILWQYTAQARCSWAGSTASSWRSIVPPAASSGRSRPNAGRTASRSRRRPPT
jgi:glucose dehydrogenase